MELVNQIILDNAILNQDLNVLYDYYSNRTAFGREQEEYIKIRSKILIPPSIPIMKNI
jgi:hypothetical protein